MQSLYNNLGSIGLGTATGAPVASIATAGISTALATAAIIDPEPFSKMALAISAGLVALFQQVFGVGTGCGQTCILASNAANQVATLLEKNVDNYTSQPIRTKSMQAQALGIFDNAWTTLQSACNNPQLGDAGKRCVSDRQQGACTWKTNQGGWNSDGTFTKFGENGSGNECWNWFVGMRDPIANDPFVVDDSQVIVQSGSNAISNIISDITSGSVTGSIFSNPLVLLAGLALVGGLYFMESKS